MLETVFKKSTKRNQPTEKILLALFILFLFRLGNTIPLYGIDQESLKKSFLQIKKLLKYSKKYLFPFLSPRKDN